MGMISLLDCTLRDGGYINDWRFGFDVIKRIMSGLESSGIDMIECGFIEDKPYDHDTTVFPDTVPINSLISKKHGTRHVGMIALGDIDPNDISNHCDGGIDGIRASFHKGDLEREIETVKILKSKGYDVFIQPVGTSSYSDEEFTDLIIKINAVHPYAFYIVDTLGTMYPKDLMRLVKIADDLLDDHIALGFHSHNNLQLSYSNAQKFIDYETERDKIIDSSVFGMGRGAGNLPTELIMQYLNDNCGANYDVGPILNIMDRYLNKIYSDKPWGYSAPYFLSAIRQCHPNYSNYLMNKRTIDVENIMRILSLIPACSRDIFDKDLIERIYISYQSSSVDDEKVILSIKELISEKKILIVAPGKSIYENIGVINEEAKNSYVIHLNGLVHGIDAEMIFVSNLLKYGSTSHIDQKGITVVRSSNIHGISDRELVVNYSDLIGKMTGLDSAGILLLNLLVKIGVKSVTLAGFDGLVDSHDYVSDVSRSFMNDSIKEFNDKMSKELSWFSNNGLKLRFITPTTYLRND